MEAVASPPTAQQAQIPHNVFSDSFAQTLEDERQLCLTNFDFFIETVFGFELGDIHTMWAMILDGRAYQDHTHCITLTNKRSAICECPVTYSNDLLPNHDAPWRNLMLMAPRNHGKSTIFSVAYVIWRIVKDPNIRVVIASYALSQSESFLRQITHNLEHNQKLKELFGNLVPAMSEKWTQREIIVARNNPQIKDPTVSAVSTGGTVLSKRADLVIGDDLLSPANTKTADQREKVMQWFNEVLKPVLEPKTGQMVVVGTAWDSADLHHVLMKRKSYQFRVRFDAIVDEATHRTLWEQRWPWEELMLELEDMGSSSFNKAYRNLVTDEAKQVFKTPPIERALMRGANRTFIYKLSYDSWDLGQLTITLGVDLAISQSRTSDYSAFAVLGRTRLGLLIPLHISKARLSFKEQQDMILDLNRRFRPDKIVVESNGYQAALSRDLMDETDLPIVPYNTGGEKFDEEVGLQSMAVGFENNKWILPNSPSSPATVEIIDELVQAMKDFPNGHTADILMALWFAHTGMRTITYTESNTGSASGGSFDIYKR